MLSDKQKEGFDYVMENIFKPLVESRGDEILEMLEQDEDMKRRVYEEVDRILEIRKMKNLKGE